MLKPQPQFLHYILLVRPIGQTSMVMFECFHKALGHAVALRAFKRRSGGFEPQLLCKGSLFNGGITRAIVREPFDGVCAVLPAQNRYSTACIIKSPTRPASMPLVVVTQLMTSRSRQSRAKATRTFSPLSQASSYSFKLKRVCWFEQPLCRRVYAYT